MQGQHRRRQQRRVDRAGLPAGIWTMDRSESCPDSAFDSTGTPNTGSGVIAAVMPGKCAAPPAPAMIT
jgi:hypothetical protein